jgi:hypothetical protein
MSSPELNFVMANPNAAVDRIEELEEEIERLRSALTQFVAVCDTAPPTSLMIELGMACKVARAALTRS